MLSGRLFKPLPAYLKYVLMLGIPSLTVLGLLGVFRRRWLSILGRPLEKPYSGTKSSSETRVEDCAKTPKTCVQQQKKEVGSYDDSVGAVVQKEDKICPTSVNGQSLCANLTMDELESKDISSTNVRRGCAEAEACGTEADISAEGSLTSKSQGNVRTPSSVNTYDAYDTTSSSIFSPNSDSVLYDVKESSRDMDRDTALAKETTDSSKKDRVRIQLQLPRDVIGRFIGKQGRNIKALMQESAGAYVYLNQKSVPKDAIIVPCTIQGTSKQVNEALAIIERKFPEINVADALVNSPSQGMLTPQAPPVFPIPPSSTVSTASGALESWECELQPACIPTKSFSATVSYIESMCHVWIVPRDISKEIDELHRTMSYSYCYSSTLRHTLPLPSNSQTDLLGRFCAVRVSEIHWLRGRIVKFGDDMLTYEVQLVDYGSYVIVPPSSINPLRKEYCKLPVLAFKAQLAHVQTLNAEASADGLLAMQQMMENMTLEIHITGSVPFNSASGEKDKDLSTWFKALPPSNGAVKPDDVSSERVPGESRNEAGEKLRSQSATEKVMATQCISEVSFISEQSGSNGDSGVSTLSTKSPDSHTPVSSRGEPSTMLDLDCNGFEQRKAREQLTREFEVAQRNSQSEEAFSTSAGPRVDQKREEKVKTSCGLGNEASASGLGNDSGLGNEASSSGLESERDGGNSCLMKEPVLKSVCANGINSSPGQSALMVEEVEMSYHKHLPDLAPYMPVVEVYTQLGAQTPTFVNRELVELGHAIWIEGKLCHD